MHQSNNSRKKNLGFVNHHAPLRITVERLRWGGVMVDFFLTTWKWSVCRLNGVLCLRQQGRRLIVIEAKWEERFSCSLFLSGSAWVFRLNDPREREKKENFGFRPQPKQPSSVYWRIDCLFWTLLLFSSGAFSNVYKAYDTKMDRLVAVKVVRKFELNAHQVTILYFSSRVPSPLPLHSFAPFLASLHSYYLSLLHLVASLGSLEMSTTQKWQRTRK